MSTAIAFRNLTTWRHWKLVLCRFDLVLVLVERLNAHNVNETNPLPISQKESTCPEY